MLSFQEKSLAGVMLGKTHPFSIPRDLFSASKPELRHASSHHWLLCSTRTSDYLLVASVACHDMADQGI